MNRRYVVDTTSSGNSVIIYRVPEGVEVVSGGTTVEAMSLQYKTAECEQYKKQYGIDFIFEDNVPAADFYAIPKVSIFATDSLGGFLGKVEITSEEPVCYIDPKRNCFVIANSVNQFLRLIKENLWESVLEAAPKTNQIQIYTSKADAEKNGVVFLDNQ